MIGIGLVLGFNLLLWLFAELIGSQDAAVLLPIVGSFLLSCVLGIVMLAVRRDGVAIGIALGFLLALLIWPGQCLVAGPGYHP